MSDISGVSEQKLIFKHNEKIWIAEKSYQICLH